MAQPINHLSGKTGYTHELLMELSDEQLAETGAYWDKRAAGYAAIQPPTKGYSGSAHGYWWCTKKQSAIYAERERRHWEKHPRTEEIHTFDHYDGWSKQFTAKNLCRVCGEDATGVDDEGWACDVHRGTLDGPVSAESRDGAG